MPALTPLTFEQELEHMRAALVPQAEGQVVGLYIQAADRYFRPEFIAAALQTYEARALCCLALDEKLSPLEQLGAIVLRSAAGLPGAPR